MPDDSAAKLLSKDEARRIAVSMETPVDRVLLVAPAAWRYFKLPELLWRLRAQKSVVPKLLTQFIKVFGVGSVGKIFLRVSVAAVGGSASARCSPGRW
jgi:hypothetical protein